MQIRSDPQPRPSPGTWRTTDTSKGGRSMVVLGDSIVSGWGLPAWASYPIALEQRLAQTTDPDQGWRVINAGQPGETVLQGLARFARDVAAHQPELVLIAFGRNDAALRRTRFDGQRERLWRATHSVAMRWRLRLERLLGLVLRPIKRWQRIPPEGGLHAAQPRVAEACFVGALRELVQQTRHCGATAALLTIWPLDAQRLPPAQVRAYARYDTLIAQVAHEMGALLLDQPQTHAAAPACSFLADGLHLSTAGQTWLAEAILEQLRENHVINLEQPPDHR